RRTGGRTLLNSGRLHLFLRLFQNRNLPSVIEIMLDHAVQHYVRGVALAGDDIAQPLVGKSSDRVVELLMRLLQTLKGPLPRLLAHVRHLWKILALRDIDDRLAL